MVMAWVVPVGVFTLFLSKALKNALLILLAEPSSIDLSIKQTATKSIPTSDHILEVLLAYHVVDQQICLFASGYTRFFEDFTICV
jgi:hypothetical protein